jgi:hypothetical protein
VAGADEDGVDGVAAGAGEAASFEEAAGLGVADNRFDGGSSAKLAPDGRRPLARALRNVDFRSGEPVAAISFVYTGARDRHVGQPLDLGDLPPQRVAIVG